MKKLHGNLFDGTMSVYSIAKIPSTIAMLAKIYIFTTITIVHVTYLNPFAKLNTRVKIFAARLKIVKHTQEGNKLSVDHNIVLK